MLTILLFLIAMTVIFGVVGGIFSAIFTCSFRMALAVLCIFTLLAVSMS